MTDILDDNEYERRFLVADLSILNGVDDYEEIDQGYLWSEGGYAIRVRGIWLEACSRTMLSVFSL